MAMVGAGLATAASPFILAQQPAGAAVTNAFDRESTTFQASGTTVECTAHLTAVHDTDNPDQPVLSWTTSMGGDEACRDDFEIFVAVTYKDEAGTARSSQMYAESLTFGHISGAYTDTSVTTLFRFRNCDTMPSPECDVTLTASPK
jgi:hypothetical protein